MPTHTQKIILTLLSQQADLSTSQLSRLTGLTAAGVRYALRALREQGLVSVSPVMDSGKPGRPQHRFRLDSPPSGTLSILAEHLLRQLVTLPDMDLFKLARDFCREKLHGSLSDRLEGLASIAYLKDHQPQWSAGPNGPRIRFGTCPFRGMALPDADGSPLTCRLDTAVLTLLTGEDVRLIASILQGSNQGCLFDIRV